MDFSSRIMAKWILSVFQTKIGKVIFTIRSDNGIYRRHFTQIKPRSSPVIQCEDTSSAYDDLPTFNNLLTDSSQVTTPQRDIETTHENSLDEFYEPHRSTEIRRSTRISRRVKSFKMTSTDLKIKVHASYAFFY